MSCPFVLSVVHHVTTRRLPLPWRKINNSIVIHHWRTHSHCLTLTLWKRYYVHFIETANENRVWTTFQTILWLKLMSFVCISFLTNHTTTRQKLTFLPSCLVFLWENLWFYPKNSYYKSWYAMLRQVLYQLDLLFSKSNSVYHFLQFNFHRHGTSFSMFASMQKYYSSCRKRIVVIL